MYYITSKALFAGSASKVADQITDAIVDYVLPKCMVEGTTPEEISKAVDGMYDACYQEAERIK